MTVAGSFASFRRQTFETGLADFVADREQQVGVEDLRLFSFHLMGRNLKKNQAIRPSLPPNKVLGNCFDWKAPLLSGASTSKEPTLPIGVWTSAIHEASNASQKRWFLGTKGSSVWKMTSAKLMFSKICFQVCLLYTPLGWIYDMVVTTSNACLLLEGRFTCSWSAIGPPQNQVLAPFNVPWQVPPRKQEGNWFAPPQRLKMRQRHSYVSLSV